MSIFDGKWIGQVELNQLDVIIEMNINISQNKLYLSFPQKGQYNIPISEYKIENNSLLLNLFDNELLGKIMLYPFEGRLLGVLIHGSMMPVTFALDYRGQCSVQGGTQYQPYPKLSSLKKLLATNKNIDFYNTLMIRYPNVNHILLKILYDNYRLDSFVKYGSELEKSVRLMKWVNKAVKQKGMVALPENRDGLNLLNYAVKGKKPLNCKGCSIILTDLLLASNIAARMVHCKSFDKYDPESHFVTEAYISEKRKWIILDAAFGCIYEESNEILDIKELRIALAEDKKIEIKNSTNTLKPQDSNKIIYFLYKNFYKFEYYESYEPGYANEYSGVEKIIINPEN